MSKTYSDGRALTEKILSGVKKLTDNVASTLGPRGRNVILAPKKGNPIITKDGVPVAKFIELEDPFENAAVQILKQASEETNSLAGDGTTTATVLARAILEQAQKYVLSGVSPIELKRGIDKAVAGIVDRLAEIATPIRTEDDILHIATISSNNDKHIGKLVAKAISCAGKDGSVTVEEAKSIDTTLDLVEGFRFDSGYAATAFITDERSASVRYNDPLILVTEEKVDNLSDLLPILEVVAREARPLVVISPEIEGQALAALIMNSMRGTMKVVAVKAPKYGEERKNILMDLCSATNATYIDSSIKLKNTKLEHLGLAQRIFIKKNETIVVGGKGDLDDIENRIETLKAVLEQSDSIREAELIQERITRLASGVAIIKVGAATEVEMIEKKHRVEDALEAVKSARMEGMVPGGGVALIRASKDLEINVENAEQQIGVDVVMSAIFEPLKKMAVNAGESPDIIMSMIVDEESENGYDFVRGEIVNMFEAGVIDPVKVTRCALQNAASAASTLLTTNFAIIEVERG